MLWELWRTSRFELLFRVVGQSAFILLIYSSMDDFSEPQIFVVRGIVVLVLTLSSVFSMTWMKELESENKQSGFSFRLGFTRPISTIGLVAVPMIFTVVAAVVCFILPASLFGLLLGVPMPIVGPATAIACIVVCFVATSWSPTTTIGKSIAVVMLLIGNGVALFLFHGGRDDPDPVLLAIGKPGYFDFAWFEYAVFLGLSTIAFLLTIFAVDRQRHGDRWEIVRPRAAGAATRGNPSGTLGSAAAKPFSGPIAAQFWYEMRRFGNRLLLFGVSFPLMVFVLIRTVLWFDPDRNGAPIVSLFALAVCPFVYQLIGADGAIGLRRKQGATRFSAFDATRSMANDQLIAVKLLVIAACSLIGWLIMGLAVGLHAVAYGDGQAWARIGATLSQAVGDVPVYWWAAGIANAALLYISSSSIFLAFGLWLPLYRNRFAFTVALLYIHLLLASWDAANGWPLRYYWLGCGYLVSVAIIGGCVFALRKALSAGYLGKRLFGCAFCLWVIYVSSTVALYLKLAPDIPIPLVVTVLGFSMLPVPLASTAIAPLALASHRHA
jgi:hypothetical protein